MLRAVDQINLQLWLQRYRLSERVFATRRESIIYQTKRFKKSDELALKSELGNLPLHATPTLDFRQVKVGNITRYLELCVFVTYIRVIRIRRNLTRLRYFSEFF